MLKIRQPAGRGEAMPTYMDIHQAASKLGITPKALYAKVTRNTVPHRRLGRRLVFDEEEIDGLIHSSAGISLNQVLEMKGIHNLHDTCPRCGSRTFRAVGDFTLDNAAE
jgi:predicted DNA-binding transcriptional regulator AlpA